MSDSADVAEVGAAIYQKIRSNSQIVALLAAPVGGPDVAIYDDVAPETAPYPFIVISLSNGRDDALTFGGGSWDNDLWQIRATDRNSSGNTADRIALLLKALLTDANGLTISGADLKYLKRESKVRYTEVEDGQMFRHSGGIYRLIYE